ncbi:6-carboxy-5,6,7,8-tetrahydropterin synthase [Heyndrickxia shackletonii]|uniref:6-carboxy-5,6,7,8-tetrahydropterin synthase n=1 Tax=Heyndrickxia shackletonii TaxID=157838 RepID=A0A0Q3TKN1_9BACI|nr:6-carboxytetrahydropterin synthase QueD [Heyndrickxia shackletonii]KQL54145.1 6-carboxy-5,6,7,8-tetrahydropterin synthase [Heyndrickxia shackletonii]NEY99298.1 6-carboxytetrahydropterin synthase QueD [Heyndrickxia shackletonii]
MLQQFYPQPAPHPYRFELNKDMNFSTAHFISNEKAGKCSFTHGHTYFVNLTIAGDELDEMGMLVNFSDLKKLVHGRYDHQLLNDFPEFEKLTPSTEVVAQTIYELVANYLDTLSNKPICLQVLVRETPTSYVIYRPQFNEGNEKHE